MFDKNKIITVHSVIFNPFQMFLLLIFNSYKLLIRKTLTFTLRQCDSFTSSLSTVVFTDQQGNSVNTNFVL